MVHAQVHLRATLGDGTQGVALPNSIALSQVAGTYVDTSKYDVMVEGAASRFTDPYKLSSLRRSLESDQVLGRVYEKVKSRLRRTFDRVGNSPTLEEIAQAFDVEMTNVYQLADAHVERTIAQYAS